MQAFCDKERKQMNICQALFRRHACNMTQQVEAAEAELAEVNCAASKMRCLVARGTLQAITGIRVCMQVLSMNKAAQAELSSLHENIMRVEASKDKHMQRYKELGTEMEALMLTNCTLEQKLARMHEEEEQQRDAVQVSHNLSLSDTALSQSVCLHACPAKYLRRGVEQVDPHEGKRKLDELVQQRRAAEIKCATLLNTLVSLRCSCCDMLTVGMHASVCELCRVRKAREAASGLKGVMERLDMRLKQAKVGVRAFCSDEDGL